MAEPLSNPNSINDCSVEQELDDLKRHSHTVTEALRLAVAEALDRKRRLGQYAIFGIDGKPVRVEAEDLPLLDADLETDM